VECANDRAIRYFTIYSHFLKIISNTSKNMAPYFITVGYTNQALTVMTDQLKPCITISTHTHF